MEALMTGLSTTGLGMIVVFLGLIFLMYIMIGLSRAGAKRPRANHATEGQHNKEVKAVPNEAIVQRQQAVAPAADARPALRHEEIAAMAAVIAILTSEGVEGIVTAVRPVGPRLNLWAFAGRRDLMASRL